jgi:gamma-glutamyltranspeptidase/glutathione hydrolase
MVRPLSFPTFVLLTALACVSAPLARSADRPTGRSFATRSEVIARNGMAATSHPLATAIAIDILKQGGNAVDAAIAANAALGLMEPTGCGIGGDLFAMVWWNRDGKLHGLNASGRSPHALTLEMLRERGSDTMPADGPLSVTVPGCVDGWFDLHERFGSLSMPQLLQPAIGYAQDGFPVTEVIAGAWQASVAKLKDWPGFMKVFAPNGHAPQKGDLFRNPALAQTYDRIARLGRETFYDGDIARRIEDYMKQHGGYLRLRDFQEHRSDWVDPQSTTYRGHEVWELPPNGQGIAVLQMLNILEGYDIKAMGFGSADYLHTFIEAKKIVYADRARFYADPAMNRIPTRSLIDKTYANERRALIQADRAAQQVEAGDPRLRRGDTIYLTVADRHGNMVSLIQSNYMGMGSGCTPEGLGFCLQNRGALFNLQPNHFNTYAPHKRPFHTIIPAFVTRDGKPLMSFGVMGGSVQPQGQVQILVNIIDFGMNIQEAGDAPRVVHNGSSQPTGSVMRDGGQVTLESGFEPSVIESLRQRGHRVKTSGGYFGGYQGIYLDRAAGVYYGASESRKDGHAAGF